MAEGFSTLVVWAKNGSKVAFQLKEKPVLTFDKQTLLIKSGDLTVSYALDQLQRYTFTQDQSVANESIQPEKECPFSLNGDHLLFYPTDKGSSVHIYSTDGKLVLSRDLSPQENVSIPIQRLRPGVYFVHVNNVTYKIMKK